MLDAFMNLQAEHELQTAKYKAASTKRLDAERVMRQQAQAESKLSIISTENSFRISFPNYEQLSKESLVVVERALSKLSPEARALPVFPQKQGACVLRQHLVSDYRNQTFAKRALVNNVYIGFQMQDE